MRRILFTLAMMLMAATLWAQPPGPTPDGFVPASSLPAVEQVPAAPLLIAAYAFFLVLMMFYLWTIWRRLGKVEQEMQALARRQAGSAR